MGEEDDENKLDMESVDIATPDEDGKPSRSILRTDGMSDPNVDHQHVRLEVISEKDTVSEKGNYWIMLISVCRLYYAVL